MATRHFRSPKSELRRLARRRQSAAATLAELQQTYPIGTWLLFHADDTIDIGKVEAHDTDGLGRPFLRISGRRSAYPAEIVQAITPEQASKVYQLAYAWDGELPRWFNLGDLGAETY